MRKNRLSAVLRLRKIQEKRARGRLAEARYETGAAEGELRRRAELPRPRPPEQALTPLQLRVLSLQGVRSHELLVEAADEVERSRLREAEAHQEWSQTSIEHKSVGRLDERRRLEAAMLARQAAERALDEMVVLRRGWVR